MSDSNMKGQRGLVIGTAGHIDHGKTSLVRALTGIDTDRLAEEKKRGISIDLGFANLALPDGRRISFIDVPGHERFIRNMLAGVGGIEAVMLIVAADESVKPQTREHFEICRFLKIERGIIVITKIDAASAEQLEAARRDARALCENSFLENAPLVTVSAVSGEGLSELKSELVRLADQSEPRDDSGLARLPIDRSFALKGFGTVVTGTLWNGRLRAGDSVQLHPSKEEARIRGLQVHGQQVEVAVAGQRTAVNLVGIDNSDIRRGFVLTHPDGLEATKLMDVEVDWLDRSRIPTAREQCALYIGTSEVSAWLKVLAAGQTASQTLARLWLSEPVLVLPDDRFVLRSPSPSQTIAGGRVIDAFPRARINRARTVARLESLAEADPTTRVEILVRESASGARLRDLVRFTGTPLEALRAVIQRSSQLVLAEAAQRVVTTTWIEERRRKLLEFLEAFHRKNPSLGGAPVAAARLGVEPNLAALIFNGFLAIRVQGDIVSLVTHKAQLSGQETQALLRMEQTFRELGLTPPAASEVLKSAGSDVRKSRGLLEALIKDRKLVRVSDDLIFHADAITGIRNLLATHRGRKFSVPEFKEWTQISRKYAIPLLEYLDRQHVTRRDGDSRIVL
ncbi:MAG: selenocysteine-specific translation elongation factor [Bryobacteraceae bacterium]